MTTNQITTVQVQGISAETLLQKFDDLENQIKTLLQPQQLTSEKLLTRKEVANLLDISLVTLHDWTKKGVLTAYRIGNRIRYKETEVMQTLTNNPTRKTI